MGKNNKYLNTLSNHNLSIVIVLLSESDKIETIIDNAKYYQQNGIEIIIVFTNLKIKRQLLCITEKFPLINWIIVYTSSINNNFSELVNVATKYSTKKYIFLSSNTIIFKNNIPCLLRYSTEEYPKTYSIVEVLNLYTYPLIVMVSKKDLISVGYLDSTIKNPEFALIQLTRKLDSISRKIVLAEAQYSYKSYKEITFCHDYSFIKRVLYPNFNKKPIYTNVSEKCILHWRTSARKISLCTILSEQFEKYSLKEGALNTKYEKIILCQSFNEISMITDFLDNMGKYFDGIILLDDGSEDGSYENAVHEKLLLKFKQKRDNFNDLKNRNALLDIASFFNSEWFCFMDLDERFDSRYAQLLNSTKKIQHDCIAFLFIHLWDSSFKYNTKMQDCKWNGFFLRWRMFRNIGRTNIITYQKKLHFAAVPYKDSKYLAPILVLHYGNLTKQQRLKKFNFYKQEDIHKDQKNYNDLINEGDTLLVRKISKTKINDAIKYMQNIIK